MIFRASHPMIVLGLAAFSLPALADECGTALITTAQAPMTMVETRTDAQGKKATAHSVQTATAKYIQTPDGVWRAIPVTIKEKLEHADEDLKRAKTTCKREGADVVGGAPVTVYVMHMETDDRISDGKIYVTAAHLILKAEMDISGAHYSTSYDYAHVTPPADAKPMGTR